MIYYEVSNSTSLPFLVASKQRQASAVLNCTSECMLLIVQILSYQVWCLQCWAGLWSCFLQDPHTQRSKGFGFVTFATECARPVLTCVESQRTDVWGISYLGTTGREPAEACLAEPKARITHAWKESAFFLNSGNWKIYDDTLWWSLIDFFACDSCTSWIVSKCFNDSLMIPRATA